MDNCKPLIFAPMEALKIDRTKLVAVSSYAKKHGRSRQTIYNWIRSGELKSVTIDGVVFVSE